jgi:hypothetical protein
VERWRGQRGDGLERHVRVILIVASPCCRSIVIVAAANSCTREECGLELAINSWLRPRGLADGPPPRGAQQDGRPRVAESPTLSGRSSEAVGGAAGYSLPTLRWLRPPRLGLPVEAPVDRLGVDAERVAGGKFRCRPTTSSVIAYPGRRSPGCTRFPHRWRGPRINPSRGGGRRIGSRAAGGAQHRHRGGESKWGSPRVGGLQAHNPRAGLVGPPGEEVPGALQDVSFRSQSLHRKLFNSPCLLT